MDIENMKNIIILKNLPSNLVEEALVVLKNNKKIKRPEMIKDKKEEHRIKTGDNKERPKDYIMKEAEMLISSYMAKLEGEKKKNNTNALAVKYKKIKTLNMVLIIMMCLGIVLHFIA